MENKQQALEKALPTNLINALQAGNKQDVALVLREFKNQNGSANFPALFNIPTKDRITELAKQDIQNTVTLIVCGVTMAMEAMNLKSPMNALQIIDLSDAIIDTSAEDNLALEDVMLFLQGLTRGKYGKLYESMDVPKFMQLFEVYRQQRYESIMEYRENKHLELKALGDPNRNKIRDPQDEHFYSMADKISELKDSLQEQKKVNQRLRDEL